MPGLDQEAQWELMSDLVRADGKADKASALPFGCVFHLAWSSAHSACGLQGTILEVVKCWQCTTSLVLRMGNGAMKRARLF